MCPMAYIADAWLKREVSIADNLFFIL